MSKKTVKTRKSYPEEFQKPRPLSWPKNWVPERPLKNSAFVISRPWRHGFATTKKWSRMRSFGTMEQLKAENKKLRKELADERENVAILKDCARFFLHGEQQVKRRGVVLLKDEGHPVKKSCRLLNISASGFYRWKKRHPSKRTTERALLKGKSFGGYLRTPRPPTAPPRVHKKTAKRWPCRGRKHHCQTHGRRRSQSEEKARVSSKNNRE